MEHDHNQERDDGFRCRRRHRGARGRGTPRTLALFDIENLLRRWPDESVERDYEHAMTRALIIGELDRRSVDLGTVDLVIGVGNHNRVGLFAAARTQPTAALRCLGGKDGGELSLLRYAADLDAVERTYDRVVIGSGDGEFADFVVELGQRTVPTVVVSWRRKLSRRLERSASEVRLMDQVRVRVAGSSSARNGASASFAA